MRNSILICLISLFCLSVFGQNGVSMQVDLLKRNKENFKTQQLFNTNVQPISIDEEITQHLRAGIFLELDKNKLKNLLAEAPETMELEVPSGKNATIKVQLYRVTTTSGNFEVIPKTIADKQTVESIHYHGIVAGDQNSLVGISLLDNEVIGMINTEDGSLTLGRMEGNLNKYHILYKEVDFLVPQERQGCATDASAALPQNYQKTPDTAKFQQMAKCVEIFVSVDYPVYVDKGAGTSAYINALFNQIALLYAAEFITVQLSTLHINFSPTIYNQVLTNDYLTDIVKCLNDFQANHSATFQGDLAILMFYGAPGGGVAYMDGSGGLCHWNRDLSMCVAFIESSYANVPAYSYPIYTTTHELGHLMGSPHTQTCFWNSNNTAIDGCVNSEPGPGGVTCPNGPYPPIGGGTVMSYCINPLTLNFNNSFGQQPGDLIYNYYQAANCTFCPGSCSLTASITPTPATCSSNGSATAYPSNGQSPFSYSWSNGQNGQTAVNLVPGTYTVNVTDANGCPAQASATVVKNCTCSMTVNITPTHVSCSANGSATAYPVSGNGPYSYSWSNGQNGQTAVNLVPGNYIVNVTDVNLCTASRLVTIIDDCNCPPVLNLNQTHNAGANETYQAEITINDTDKINNGASINCKAGTRVVLKPGFNAKPGSYFRANIENCPP